MRLLFKVLLFTGAVLTASAATDMGKLKVYTSTGRAGIFVDDKYIGPVGNLGWSLTYKVPAGPHEVKLSDPRFEDYVQTVTFEPGKLTTIRQKLKPLPAPQPPFGTIRTISADKYTAVYVNGKFMGHADEFNGANQGLQVNPGEYTIKLVSSRTAAAHEQQIKVEADKVTVVQLP